MEKKKIYIAGKVTGEPQKECFLKFLDASIHLQNLGFEPVNPLDIVPDSDTPWNIAMKYCIQALMECDGIYLLPDYAQSRGAMIELTLAKELNMSVYFKD